MVQTLPGEESSCNIAGLKAAVLSRTQAQAHAGMAARAPLLVKLFPVLFDELADGRAARGEDVVEINV